MENAEPIAAPTLLADADRALDEDDKRALSLALGYNIAVLSLPSLQIHNEHAAIHTHGHGEVRKLPQPADCVAGGERTRSITANERGEISIHVVPYIDTKTALDLAGALAAVVARIAGGDLPKPPGRED